MSQVPQDIIDLINNSDHFLGHLHVRPDADSLGSMLGLRLGLQQLRKELTLYCEDEVNKVFNFLKDVDQVERINLTGVYKQKDTVYLFLDTGKWQMATHDERIPNFPHPIVNIDHHPDNSVAADFSWVDGEASCVSEMVLKLLRALKIEITPDIADCLLVGLLGDTYTFQNKNTNNITFQMAADLLSAGADYQKCLFHLARSKSPEYFKALGFVASNLKLSEDKKFVYVAIGYDDWQKIGGGSIAEIANEVMGTVDETLFGAVLAEKEPGVTKGSIRSRETDMDVSQIARVMGGGGHKTAAGFKLDLPIDKAEAEFLSAVKKAGYNKPNDPEALDHNS